MLLGCLQEGEAAPAGCGVAIVDDLTTVYLSLRWARRAARLHTGEHLEGRKVAHVGGAKSL